MNNSKKLDLKYIVIDRDNKFFNEIKEYKHKYDYLEKEFDFKDINFENEFIIYKINYEKKGM